MQHSWTQALPSHRPWLLIQGGDFWLLKNAQGPTGQWHIGTGAMHKALERLLSPRDWKTDSFLCWASKPSKCKWTVTFGAESWHSLSISFEHGFWKAFQHHGMIGVLTVTLFQKHDSAATVLPIHQFCSYQPKLQLQLQLSAILQLSASVITAFNCRFERKLAGKPSKANMARNVGILGSWEP